MNGLKLWCGIMSRLTLCKSLLLCTVRRKMTFRKRRKKEKRNKKKRGKRKNERVM